MQHFVAQADVSKWKREYFGFIITKYVIQTCRILLGVYIATIKNELFGMCITVQSVVT